MVFSGESLIIIFLCLLTMRIYYTICVYSQLQIQGHGPKINDLNLISERLLIYILSEMGIKLVTDFQSYNLPVKSNVSIALLLPVMLEYLCISTCPWA